VVVPCLSGQEQEGDTMNESYRAAQRREQARIDHHRTQVRKPLPRSLMRAIKDVLADRELTLAERFEAVLLITHGYGLWQQADSLEVSAYAIPEEQWQRIATLLQEAAAPSGDDLSDVQVTLAWMNTGPSAYKEES
jgi:hypothetical protein